MGLRAWLAARFKKAAPDDPVQAYDRRLQTLAARAGELRRSVATLYAAREELDRGLSAAKALEEEAQRRGGQAQDDAVRAVLEADAVRARARFDSLTAERARLEATAKELAGTIAAVEAEAEALRRERETAAARIAASRSMTLASGQALADDLRDLSELDRARDEVERAQALADLAREDLARGKPKR